MLLRWTCLELLWLPLVILLSRVLAQNCWFNFEDRHRVSGMSLEGRIVRMHAATLPVDCFLKCAQDCRCISFNYIERLRKCELNNGSVELTPSLLQPRTDSSYYSLRRKSPEENQVPVSVKSS